MSKNKDKEENTDNKSNLKIELLGIFKRLHIHEDKVDELMGALNLDKKLNSSNMEHRDFCKAYTIELIKKCGSTADEKELLLVAYGLLEGFEFKPEDFENRIYNYWKYNNEHDKYNKLLAGTKTENEKSILRNIRTKQDRIISNLVDMIVKLDDNEKNELINKVPEQLRLPKPKEVYSNNSNPPGSNKPDDGQINGAKWKYGLVLLLVTIFFLNWAIKIRSLISVPYQTTDYFVQTDTETVKETITKLDTPFFSYQKSTKETTHTVNNATIPAPDSTDDMEAQNENIQDALLEKISKWIKSLMRKEQR